MPLIMPAYISYMKKILVIWYVIYIILPYLIIEVENIGPLECFTVKERPVFDGAVKKGCIFTMYIVYYSYSLLIVSFFNFKIISVKV